MRTSRSLQAQISGLSALKDRLSEASFARRHVTRLHSAAEALGTIASSNDGTGERAYQLASSSRRFLDSIQRAKTDISVRQAGGLQALGQEFAERVGLQSDRYANEIVQAFGRAERKDQVAWLSQIVESGDGRSLAAIMEAPEFVTGVDRKTLGEFRNLMEQQRAPDLAAKRKVFEADVETAQVAIEQASRVAQDVLQIKDVDSAVDDRQRVVEAQANFRAAVEE